MDALTALQERNSVHHLTEPAPSKIQLENIFKAGLRACDHGNLRPWKFLVIDGEAREKFGELMVKVKSVLDGKQVDDELANKLRRKPLRAPTIVAVVARIVDHQKIPEIEQVMSTAASAQMMMTAAHAQGIGAIWRSGALMFHESMREGLGLRNSDQIVGFIYLGTPKFVKPLPKLDTKDFIEIWQG
ncbi:MAG: NAD(P)H nitroreductase [Acidiferrobacterales bacterium]|nr:NAD(P)H nitroreductase [Acidiferrobacterales bacterium]